MPLDAAVGPAFKDFDLVKALRRIRLIGVAARGLLLKKRMLAPDGRMAAIISSAVHAAPCCGFSVGANGAPDTSSGCATLG